MKTTESLNPLKRLQQRKELLVILVFLFVIVIVWIALSLFSSQQKTGITAEQQKLAQPLTPVLDESVIEKLEAKKMYTSNDLADFPILTAPSAAQTVRGSATGVAATSAPTEVILPSAVEGQLKNLEQNF